MQHIDVGPPTPPGSKDGERHFAVLLDPGPPPPPHPPPRPPRNPPPPLPAALGIKSDTHIDCEFFEETDFSLKAEVDAEYADMQADSEKHCCSICGTRAGCTDFVYEPASHTCVLIPHVSEGSIVKNSNPSTIAGSVRITRLVVNHVPCHFDVGSGYSGGTLGMAKLLPGKTKMATKQERRAPSPIIYET